MDWSSIVLGGLTAGATLLLAYLSWKAWKEGNRERLEEQRHREATTSPVAEFTITNLPPYENDSQNTELIVTNRGNCDMVQPRTRISYTWGGIARLHLDWENDEVLVPNEQKTFRFRLPTPPLGLGVQEILVQCQCIHPIRKQIVEWSHTYELPIGR